MNIFTLRTFENTSFFKEASFSFLLFWDDAQISKTQWYQCFSAFYRLLINDIILRYLHFEHFWTHPDFDEPFWTLFFIDPEHAVTIVKTQWYQCFSDFLPLHFSRSFLCSETTWQRVSTPLGDTNKPEKPLEFQRFFHFGSFSTQRGLFPLSMYHH